MQARCCCGSLTLGVTGAPVMNAICHCDDCKRRTGAAFGWSVYFLDAAVSQPQGEARTYAFDAASGRQERSFCPNCGSTVFWRSAAFGGLTGVAGGCLPPDEVGEPNISGTDPKRCAWITLPEGWGAFP